MSSLTDQQLRQELSKFGETVPPITQRNREQLRARLEVLRSAKTTRSNSKNRTPVSSPSRTRNRSIGSPLRPPPPPPPAQPTTPSRVSTRSKGVAKNLVELSDSEVESPRTIQTRSSRRLQQDTTPTISVTDDVEQSIARHRREIQQLINTARDRTKATSSNNTTTTNTSSSSSPTKTPVAKKENFGKNILKIFVVSFLFITGLTLAVLKGAEYFPQRQEIRCTTSDCEDLKLVINAVENQLKIRKGEIECGFRDDSEKFVTRQEIEQNLDRKGLVFADDDLRWRTIIRQILSKPNGKIHVFNEKGQPTTIVGDAAQLSGDEATHSFICRAQRDVHKTLRNLGLFVLGSTGLLTLAWFFSRRSKEHDDEQTFKVIVEEAICLLREQYEEHIRNPQKEPWLTINHIREKLIPSKDQERLRTIWDKVKKHLSEQESRVQFLTHKIRGEDADVWQWIKTAVTPKKPREESLPIEEGLTECLKLRNFFTSTKEADDREIDQVVDSIQTRCANIKRIEHIGIHSVFVYLKFSSKEAAAQGYHQLNNWNYHGREINAKYIRSNRYHEHFPEADESKKK